MVPKTLRLRREAYDSLVALSHKQSLKTGKNLTWADLVREQIERVLAGEEHAEKQDR